jgi:urocanate hydratase
MDADKAVAEDSARLVVYGGEGRAARSWADYDRIVSALHRLGGDETLLVQSGRPVVVLPSHPDAPRVLISTAMLVPQWSGEAEFERLQAAGLTMFVQMTTASWFYIGTQGILGFTHETFAAVALVANIAEIAPRLVADGVTFDIATDQTAAHDPLHGYVPAGWSPPRARAAASTGEPAHAAAVRGSLAAHARALLALRDRGTVVFEYGNGLRARAQLAGCAGAAEIPGFIAEYVAPSSPAASAPTAGSA